MRILFLDIEVSPTIAPVWGVWNPHIDVSNLIGNSYVLCWAAKWLGDDEMMWRRCYGKEGKYRKDMLRNIHRLLDSADAVVHYNGSRKGDHTSVDQTGLGCYFSDKNKTI